MCFTIIYSIFFSYSTDKTQSLCANPRYTQCLKCFSYLLTAVYPFYGFFGAILKQKLIKKTKPRVDILSWYFARRAMSNTKTQTHVRKSALKQRGRGDGHGMSTKDHHLHETCGNSHMARWTHEAPRARLFPLHPRSVFLTRHGNDAEATLEEKR